MRHECSGNGCPSQGLHVNQFILYLFDALSFAICAVLASLGVWFVGSDNFGLSFSDSVSIVLIGMMTLTAFSAWKEVSLRLSTIDREFSTK